MFLGSSPGVVTAHTSYEQLSHQELRDMVNDFVV